MAPPPSSLVFKVNRQEPELITPAEPTPHEFKALSDIDDQEVLRFQIPVIQFYRYNPSMQGKDPAKLIREAIVKTLVFYYPFAGRLREGPNRKLLVECTGEGIMFIEAEADVTLDQFGDAIQPPFPCLEELLFDAPGSDGVLNSPLMLIQVTRLKCGGTIFALRLNHTMSDAQGLVQFLSAVGEMARGEPVPSILPVWERHLLSAREPPRVTCKHREYEEVANNNAIAAIVPLDDMVHRSFFFGPTEVSALRRHSPAHPANCSIFEILTACLWKCRTIALRPGPDEVVSMIFVVSARNKFDPPLPTGYYGNAFAFRVALAPAGNLARNPLGYALELIRKAKAGLTKEYMQSLADLMVIKGRPQMTVAGSYQVSYLVSDVRHAGFKDLDFGWGKPAYGGPAKAGIGPFPGVGSFYIPYKNHRGEEGLLLPICLPADAMERFVKELDKMLNEQSTTGGQSKSKFVVSPLESMAKKMQEGNAQDSV